jgi:hypothetical protein
MGVIFSIIDYRLLEKVKAGMFQPAFTFYGCGGWIYLTRRWNAARQIRISRLACHIIIPSGYMALFLLFVGVGRSSNPTEVVP